jgi:ATP-binding cassette subfamily B protein
VRHADHILVVEDGRVIEAGTHDELLARGSRYATMFHLQAARFRGEEVEGQALEELEEGAARA